MCIATPSVVCDLVHTIRRSVKRKFKPCLRTWKLRDPAVAKEFAISSNAKLTAAQVMNFPNVEEIWAHLKKSSLETSSEVSEPPVETPNMVVERQCR